MKKILGFGAVVALMAGIILPTLAADKPGAKDDPLIPRYSGSSIIGYMKKSFDQLTIALSPIASYDSDKKTFGVAKTATFRGELTRLVYLVPTGPSSLEVAENYRQSLSAAGFKIMFESGGTALGEYQSEWFGAPLEDQICQLLEYSPKASHYIAAERNQNGQKTDIALYVTEYQDGTRCDNEVKDAQVIAELFVIKSGTMTNKMVTVSASDIQKGIDAQGHIAIYGIYFDTNKVDLKPESKPSLEQVAAYLKQNPAMNIHVVGHTDSVGLLDANLKLSRGRAAAVVAALVHNYGVPENRLNPAGVGSLAPVATNTTDSGRAKNRRVELIPL